MAHGDSGSGVAASTRRVIAAGTGTARRTSADTNGVFFSFFYSAAAQIYARGRPMLRLSADRTTGGRPCYIKPWPAGRAYERAPSSYPRKGGVLRLSADRTTGGRPCYTKPWPAGRAYERAPSSYLCKGGYTQFRGLPPARPRREGREWGA